MNPPLPPWPQAKVWIIGASSGIGAATAEALLRQGATVALSARNAEALADIACGHDKAFPAPFDYTDTQAFRAAWQLIRDAFGGIDLILFVAGTYVPTRAWELDAEAADATLDTNYGAVVRGVSVVLPDLLTAGQGAIGLVSSVAGYGGLPLSLTYGPTKAALINFAEALYIDLHPKGLGVYLICPGFVATPMTAQNDFLMPALLQPQEAAEKILGGLARGDFDIHFPRRFTRWLKALRLMPYSGYFKAIWKATRL